MPVTNVVVKDFWLPEGKKRWVLKDSRDELYGVPEKFKEQIIKGQTYELIYVNDEWKGKTYRVVSEITPTTGIGQSQTSPTPPIRTGTAGGFSSGYAPTTKDEDIATLAIAKEQLSKINPGDIEMGLHVLKSSAMMWRKFKDWQKLGPQTAKEEMNDEIPEL